MMLMDGLKRVEVSGFEARLRLTPGGFNCEFAVARMWFQTSSVGNFLQLETSPKMVLRVYLLLLCLSLSLLAQQHSETDVQCE
jgi:hypothetical protein